MYASRSEDLPCIVGVACRLPGGVLHYDTLWSVFSRGDWHATSRPPPESRNFASFRDANPAVKGGWIGEEGVESFDPLFFGIPLAEAATLRPNVRLGLELTYEALENAGIAPASLRGKNVAVAIGVGTEDGWDMKRWNEDGARAFDHDWAASSDPSGISGRISHFYDFRGSSSIVSAACASGAFALREGISALFNEEAEVAVVGSLTTHFTPAPFAWAASTGVVSATGRSGAFSSSADGYSPSEGAVFFVLKKLSKAQLEGDPVYGIVRAFASGHSGATKTLITPSPRAQAELSKRVLRLSNLNPADVSLLEAHGTGTPVGDALEAEGIRSVYGSRTGNPLILSSSKTVMGHCHGAAALVGILKVLTCFDHRQVPPHHVPPRPEFLSGPIIIPSESVPLQFDPLIAQVNAFGFTGSISSIIIEELSRNTYGVEHPDELHRFLLPFSSKSSISLSVQIRTVLSWALKENCSLYNLAAILSICRDHHPHRRAFIVKDHADLAALLDGDNFLMSRSSDAIPIDDNITVDLLNLEHVRTTIFSETFLQDDLDALVEKRSVLDAARHLYQLGHTLSFSCLFSKRHIDASCLRSFPFYQFNRQRHWRSSSSAQHPIELLDNQSAEGPSDVDRRLMQEINQANFENLIRIFGAPFKLSEVPEPNQPNSLTHILLTGGNGMVGSRLLQRLLQDATFTVYCIVRGDPWIRLTTSFTKHNLDSTLLHQARSRGNLKVMRTTDLCGPRLGLTDDDYNLLLDTVGQVVHATWNVNFNLPLVEFQPFLRCTRNLAEFCLTAKNKVRLNFLGSYASTFNYPDDYVPESALDTELSYSLAQGYAISKLLAEHSLLQLREAHPQGFDLSIIRIGQICGDTKTGSWSPHEMMPMLIASLPTLKALPICFPPVSWIPADICAGALFDIISADISAEPRFLHVANPHLVSWLQIGAQIGEISQIGEPSFLSLGEYIQLLKDQPSPVPVSPLLPYFTQALESDTMPERYASLRVVHTTKFSESLRMCPSIGPELLKLMVQGILRVKASASSHTIANSPIFLFGPWSPSSRDVSISPNVMIEQRVMGMAKRIQSKLGVTVLSPGSSLEQQLKALIAQLSQVDSLLKRNITPCAVLGYCFGEYCAAITAGILSEENVIDVLIRRATVTAEVKGAMLNVFGEVAIVRRYLASMQSPPCIGIHAGPKHVILTGGRDDIISARDGLLGRGIKSMMIDTTLPFHSSLMEVPISNFDPPTTYTPRDSDSSICFISGITSEFLPGSKLGWKYWLRHLRDPVDFYGAMRYARHNLPGRTFVDIGPGQMLTKIIDRFQWLDIIVVGPGDVAPANMNPVEKFLSHTTAIAMKPKSRPLISRRASSGQDFHGIALQLLKDLFGYEPLPGLLEHSLHSLGLQSLDFIRFSDSFEAQTGVRVSLSAFVSDLSLKEIIDGTPEPA